MKVEKVQPNAYRLNGEQKCEMRLVFIYLYFIVIVAIQLYLLSLYMNVIRLKLSQIRCPFIRNEMLLKFNYIAFILWWPILQMNMMMYLLYLYLKNLVFHLNWTLIIIINICGYLLMGLHCFLFDEIESFVTISDFSIFSSIVEYFFQLVGDNFFFFLNGFQRLLTLHQFQRCTQKNTTQDVQREFVLGEFCILWESFLLSSNNTIIQLNDEDIFYLNKFDT